MSQRDLAYKLQLAGYDMDKNVITRIETGKMTPDIKLTKKFEKVLNIKLLEKTSNVDLNQFINTSTGERTLGSIMKIKRK